MADEDESFSEGFSASEDEWKPVEIGRGGESSDDDDSDFDEVPAGGASGRSSANATKKREQKPPSGIKGASMKKRKPTGQSLRSKLYNKYRPPPKTFPGSQNSPSASGSNRVTASKNAKTPNESDTQEQRNDDSSSESSVEDYLVNPADIDLHSSFFSAPAPKKQSPAPQFDCNAGITNLSDSGSEDNNESSIEDNATKAFDFRGLLENANSLERTKEILAKRSVTATPSHAGHATDTNADTMDVNALLALGENQNYANLQNEDKAECRRPQPSIDGPSRLSKTKSTRIKRHTKTRPASTVVAAGDTDDSEFEEVADMADEASGYDATPNVSGDLEIVVGLPIRQKEKKSQHELDLQIKRRMNRDIKLHQVKLHKVSLMMEISRSYLYNKLLTNTNVMQATLKLLPSKNAYPTERGTEIKYLQSFVTWFKSAIKLGSPNMFPEKVAPTKQGIIEDLLEQIKRKEARCKQDMVFIFVALARSMGMHCRLIVNLQPISLRPPTSQLIPIKLKVEGAGSSKKSESKSTGDDEETDFESEGQVDKKRKINNATKNKTQKKDTESNTNPKASTQTVPKSKVTTNSQKAKDHDKAKPTQSTKSVSKIKPIGKTADMQIKKTVHFNESPLSSGSGKSIHDEHLVKDSKPKLSRLKRSADQHASKDSPGVAKKPNQGKALSLENLITTPIARRTRKALSDKDECRQDNGKFPAEKIGSPILPKIVLHATSANNTKRSVYKISDPIDSQKTTRVTRSRSKSPKVFISSTLFQTNNVSNQPTAEVVNVKEQPKKHDEKIKISSEFLRRNSNQMHVSETKIPGRQLRSQKTKSSRNTNLKIPQLDGADDVVPKKRLKLENLRKTRSRSESDEDFENSPKVSIKKTPVLPKSVQNLRKDRRVLSTDDEANSEGQNKRKPTAVDMWAEIWSEAEEEWICLDLFKSKVHCVDSIRKSASSNLAYVFAFQGDLSIKDLTARYCPTWTTTVRKGRVEKAWLDETLENYLGHPTKRDILENQQLRRIHENKPMPTSISELKDHPLYVLERHLLKFQGLYPPDAPTLGFIRGEPIYARECVHLLHSRDIWLKSARVVKLGEQPYKIVKARPKWDKLTRTVIKDQPLEIFGYWQTQQYEPPTAENGIVPRNAYGNVELFKACMLPKKTVHLRLPGLMRICKKLNIDCANAVIGFDFHQGACHPMYDGFVVCEEFKDTVTDAWEEDQQEQARKEREKYEARVYGNWKKLIKGVLIRERLKKKYNF